jgi:hypothetical protein
VKQSILLTFAGLMFLFSSAGKSFGQSPRHNYVSPKAILVQLRSEQRKLTYLVNAPEKAAVLARDAAAIRRATINDFRDHFIYCPVYFYIDTNADKIKAKQLDNVLFTADGTMLPHVQLQDYYIVYYGHPQDPVGSKYKHDNGDVLGNGLVVLDENYKQTQQPFPYYVWKLVYSNIGKWDTTYAYKSKEYDIEYYHLATTFSRELDQCQFETLPGSRLIPAIKGR